MRADATLSKGPRDLFVLWEECDKGIDGRIPAKAFGYRERGRVSSLYGKRNKVWQLIKRLMVEHEITHTIAIDKIYAAYGGNTSPTKIVKLITTDTRTFDERFATN